MTKAISFAALLALSLGAALFTNPGQSSASFHVMRIDAAMAGYYGNTNIQYVELRMADSGQTLVHFGELCFFDSLGAPYARYKFPADVGNGTDGASVLIGTTEFDTAWAAGAPDFTFTAPDASPIAGGADATHPLRAPGGKIAYGSDGLSAPFCAGSFSVVDSVAYGAGTDYTGPVDLGTKFASDIPTNSSNGLHLVGPLCYPSSFLHPCGAPRDNSVDYGIADLNAGGNQPRNNGGLQGPLTNDIDGDGVPNASDNCPNWFNPTQVLPNWTVPAGDSDCDGFPDSVPIGAPNALNSETNMGTDPASHCAATPARNDEGPPDRWPVDFDDNQTANGSDLLTFAPLLGSVMGDGRYDPRWDINNDGRISGSDLLKMAPFLGKHCAQLLTVNKVCSPTTDTGKFNLQIDGVTPATGANVACGGSTGTVVVSIGAHTVSETAGTGTNLADYTTVISGNCAGNGAITLAVGDVKTCTITNTHN